MPKGIWNAHVFQFFNTFSFSIVIGAHMILYFKYLGASATVIGIVTALPNILNILQIPAASFVERVGYRNFVLRGWTARTFIILGIVCVPAIAFRLGGTTGMMLMIFLLFAYNFSRGISACGFLPWMTHLVPENVRGTFVSRDQAFGAVASFITVIGGALLFRAVTGATAYTISFSLAFLTAAVSLTFLRRIPDIPVPPESRSTEKIPWRSMILYRPFLKLLVYNVVVNLGLAGAGVLWVPTLRDVYHWPTTDIFLLTSVAAFFAISVIWGFGRIVDRVGSRPLLAFSGLCLFVHFMLWAAVSTRLLYPHFAVVVVLELFAALGSSVFGMANTRLAMATVPAMGRSHFFALFSVTMSIALGVGPIFWGILADSLAPLHIALGATGEINHYTVCYVGVALICLSSLLFLKKLDEPRAMTTEAFFHELFVATPWRAISRLIYRRPPTL
ncbi:MFS-type transporter involved in bile tolerance, Atg22 family [Verrucomicrobium sp. GAS474]|uniref:MFS transporter n=1 Tax=Verrucomicrobium sp. GAS474 TaxID=1882831 RepID=UPI00087D3F34|nr:MFS transporter [Verrucomicrobium sp. GAS474]SDU25342.1 MFS-type transporter involved in bile tolerance, Atg22 family [Verrucomicrobium sp. GAS474]